MRLSAFAVIAASAALAQVSAAPAPLRLLVVSSYVEEAPPLNGIRFGHAVPAVRKDDVNRELLNTSPPASLPATGIPVSPDGKPVHPKRPGCNKGSQGHHSRPAAILVHRIKIKAIKIGNCFRKALGWPLIEVKHHHHHHHHHHGKHPHIPKEKGERIRVDGGFVSILPFPAATAAKGDWAGVSDIPHDHINFEGDHKPKHFHKHHGAFLSRLHYSLMNLGRWEGRAVAFVIGCGIGVLIRMFWVLGIVSYRACRGHRDDGYATVAVMEEYDSDDETVIFVPSPKTGPPKYIYPADEKVAVDESD